MKQVIFAKLGFPTVMSLVPSSCICFLQDQALVELKMDQSAPEAESPKSVNETDLVPHCSAVLKQFHNQAMVHKTLLLTQESMPL